MYTRKYSYGGLKVSKPRKYVFRKSPSRGSPPKWWWDVWGVAWDYHGVPELINT